MLLAADLQQLHAGYGTGSAVIAASEAKRTVTWHREERKRRGNLWAMGSDTVVQVSDPIAEPFSPQARNFISRGGNSRKSIASAMKIVMADKRPMSALILYPESSRIKKPAPRAAVVTHMAVPTVLKL